MGRALADYLIRQWQFVELRQTGSQIILRSDTPVGHTVAVPAHKPVRTGTLSQILSYIARNKGVSVAAILKNF